MFFFLNLIPYGRANRIFPRFLAKNRNSSTCISPVITVGRYHRDKSHRENYVRIPSIYRVHEKIVARSPATGVSERNGSISDIPLFMERPLKSPLFSSNDATADRNLFLNDENPSVYTINAFYAIESGRTGSGFSYTDAHIGLLCY